jgi:hypothetical protein
MRYYKLSLIALLLVAGCDGNPFVTDGTTDPGTDGETTSDFVLTGTTTNATSDGSITRVENQNTESGNGYATGYSYDADADTFSVDNLAFDGENVYRRDAAFKASPTDAPGTLPTTGVNIFEGKNVVKDNDGEVVDQFTYKALYGVSTSGKTEFAIVRTGSYVGYGFGGFVYKRNGKVTIPTVGQAHFEGDYSAIRDFSGPDTIPSGIEYVTGSTIVDIDFADFNDTTGTIGDGVKGYIYDREVYDVKGNNVTSGIVDALNGTEGTATELPVLVFDVGPGVITSAGEVTSVVNSYNAGESYEAGTYYAVISGTGAEEIVGIVVVESTDPRNDAVTVRETGGFIVYN